MLEVKHITKELKGQKILNDISLSLPRESILFVLGRSGVGKSVLLKTIVGLIIQDKGTVMIDGVPTDPQSEENMVSVRKKCGLVFQMPALLDSLTVEENLLFAIEGLKPTDLEEKLSWVGLEKSCLKSYPLELSFGVQKKVSLLRTLLLAPDYLLFDEPTTGLDPVSTELTNQTIVQSSRIFKAGCLVVSHDVRSALKLADEIILLDSGTIVFRGSPQEFQKSEIQLVRNFLKGTVFFE